MRPEATRGPAAAVRGWRAVTASPAPHRHTRPAAEAPAAAAAREHLLLVPMQGHTHDTHALKEERPKRKKKKTLARSFPRVLQLGVVSLKYGTPKA